jgi:hypothetical protein
MTEPIVIELDVYIMASDPHLNGVIHKRFLSVIPTLQPLLFSEAKRILLERVPQSS